MAHERRFRFGVQRSPAASAEQWVAQVRPAEDLGYDSVLLPHDFGDQLAKEVATLDVLSGGRIEFGLGAGWMTTDHERSDTQAPLKPLTKETSCPTT